MSVLFCHDHRFIIDSDGAVFSRGPYSEAIVARYERAFGKMFIAARTMPAPHQLDRTAINLVFEDPSRFVPLPDLSSVRSLLFRDGTAQRQLEELMEGVDAVIVRLPSEIGLLAGAVARQRGKPLITEVVGCWRDSLRSHGRLGARTYAPIASWRMRRAVAMSDWTLYVTERFLQNRYPSRGERASVSNVQLPPRNDHLLPRRLDTIGSSGRPLVFGMVAAMAHNEKRVDVAIRALAEATATRADIRLRIVGAGDTSALETLAEKLDVRDRVEFLGVLPHGERLFSFLDDVDVYVQTSFQEGLPRALIEAMSRALPALASDVGGTNELLAREWLHPPGDTRTLARQLLHLHDPVLRARLAEENFARAADFEAHKLDARRLAFWKSFCASHGIGLQPVA